MVNVESEKEKDEFRLSLKGHWDPGLSREGKRAISRTPVGRRERRGASFLLSRGIERNTASVYTSRLFGHFCIKTSRVVNRQPTCIQHTLYYYSSQGSASHERDKAARYERRSNAPYGQRATIIQMKSDRNRRKACRRV